MMRRRRSGRSKFPAFILGLAGILICVTCMSAETLLVILSLLLIALGVWLLFSAEREVHIMKIVVCKTPRILAGFLRLFFGIKKTES